MQLDVIMTWFKPEHAGSPWGRASAAPPPWQSRINRLILTFFMKMQVVIIIINCTEKAFERMYIVFCTGLRNVIKLEVLSIRWYYVLFIRTFLIIQ